MSGRDQGPRRVGETVPRLLARLGLPMTTTVLEAVFTRWDEVAGEELSAHVRPVRVDGRALVVAADHAAWATRARMESQRILDQVHALGGDRVERLEVVVDRA
jgi:predicted nucleic acid-binding Zn ribbon protein